MGRFGERLRRERELREITLEEVATATKIGTRALRALEEEKFDQLPGGIFNKGFVRAYARYVGIDEEVAVSDYLEAAKASSEGKQEQELLNISLIAKQIESSRPPSSSRRQGATFIWTLIVVLGLVSAGIAGWPYFEKWRLDRKVSQAKIALQDVPRQVQAASTEQVQPAAAPATQAPPDAASVPAAPAAAPNKQADTATSGTTPTTADAATKGLSLVVAAKQRAWVEVLVDGKSVMRRTLDPESSDNREHSFRAKRQLVLNTGNPNGLDLTFNGEPYKLGGSTNVPRSITFTPEGVQQNEQE